MKQVNEYIVVCMILLLGLMSCTKDDANTSTQGTISIGVILDTSVKTKAVENIQDPIKLTIVKSDKDGKPVPESPMYEYDLTTDRSREISLNADTYLLTAIVGKDPKGSPASEPYYVGIKIVTLTAGKTEKITMDCKLTTAVIVVDYSGLSDYGGVDDYQTIVENSTGNITFSKNSGTKGYFVAGKALSVTFRYKIGTTWTEKAMPEIATLVAQHQYTIKYTVKDDGSAGNTGSAGIGIEITSPSEKDVQIDITIPLDLSVRIFPDETSAEIIGSVKTNTELKNASFEYKAKDDTEWTLVPLDSDLKAKISELKSGQLYNYKFTCAGNEKTGDFVTSPTVNPWATFALFTAASGNPDDFKDIKLKYRKKNATDWIESSELKLSNLEPTASYEYMFVSDGIEREIVSFMTESSAVLTNGSFNNWGTGPGLKISGKPDTKKKVWYADTQDKVTATNSYWDSGNLGASIMDKSPTSPVDNLNRGKAVELRSQYVGISFLKMGKFAAGNIYVGQYMDTYTTGAMGARIRFGRPFNSRPTGLKGVYKYTPADINYVLGKEESNGLKDKCAIYVALTDVAGYDGQTAFEVNTQDGKYVDFTLNNPDIIAYGSISESESLAAADWTSFTIDIKYKDLIRQPKYLIVVASASIDGDYFTGGEGSLMYIDDFELLYDSEYLKTE